MGTATFTTVNICDIHEVVKVGAALAKRVSPFGI